MLTQYRKTVENRLKQGVPPLPLRVEEVEEVLRLLEKEEADNLLIDLLENRVEPGVGNAAELKAKWLEKVIWQDTTSKQVSPSDAVRMLSTMIGGECVEVLIRALDNKDVQKEAANALKHLTKVYDAFDIIAEKADSNSYALAVIKSWAAAEWFLDSPPLPDKIDLRVYKVDGEINTDDLSPGNQAHTRTDIPLHANYFGTTRFPDGINALKELQKTGPVAFAGDVVGTGSSRKSAVNSMLWHIGDEIPGVPNKKRGGFVLGGTIAPIFYGSARDAGLLPIQCDMSDMKTGQILTFYPKKWEMMSSDGKHVKMQPPPMPLLDEYRAGGRLNLLIGKDLTKAACRFLKLEFPRIFSEDFPPRLDSGQGFTLAQKILGRACGVQGILPGTFCLPKISTVGSQDTTGPMTMQEIDELACRKFKTDFFLQTFCHTAAYPNKNDLGKWQILTSRTHDAGGLALKPGDGVIHSWINKMLIPDQVGTGGDSHTRFPLGISFPAGSSLIAFAAALGVMPLEMPGSVLVRFHGKRRPGITVRDMVHAIPYFAIKEGLLSIDGEKYNVFSGEILEIEGVEDLTVEEAFELSDSSAERSASACTIRLSLEKVKEHVEYNINILQDLINRGYQSKTALHQRIVELNKWLEKPELLVRDENAVFKAVLDIDLDKITQPILACPNNPDDVKMLEDVAGEPIDDVFIGSCMTHLNHLRLTASILSSGDYAQSRLWIAPTTRMDESSLKQEGVFSVFASAGARIETPGCSLCMGNQIRVQPGATVLSTSTRNFPNRLGYNTRVYLGSTEVAAISSLLGKIPHVSDYFDFVCNKKRINQESR